MREALADRLAIAGIAESQALIDHNAENNIGVEVEVIPIERVNDAWKRVVAKAARYRYVIDVQSLGA